MLTNLFDFFVSIRSKNLSSVDISSKSCDTCDKVFVFSSMKWASYSFLSKCPIPTSFTLTCAAKECLANSRLGACWTVIRLQLISLLFILKVSIGPTMDQPGTVL